MNTDTTTIHKTNGRKTTNDALTTLLRAGVIASIMMLVLGAGMAAATESVADDEIQAAFAEDKIQSMSSQTEIFVGQGFDKCEIPTLSQMQNWITNSPYGAVNLYIGGSCRSCSNSALTASYVSQLSQQGWKFIPTWVGPQSTCWGGSCGSISNDPATAYNQGISEANAAIDAAIDLGLALADGSGTIIYYDLEGYDTTNTACRNAAKSFISGWTAQLHARGSKAGVYGSACSSAISDFSSISNVPDAIWPAHWIHSSYNSGATVWDVACLSNGIWVNHQRIRQYAGGHDETWGGVTLNIDSNVIDGIVASVGDKFNIGDTVRVTENLNVRTGPGTSYLEITDPDYPGFAPEGTTGNVLDGPSSADGYIWWKIDYGPGSYSGWSVEGGLEKVEDDASPTVDAFSVSPASVTLGNSFTSSYTVSDTGGSGLNRVELWRKSETVDWQEIDRTSLAGVGNGPYSGSFSDAPPSVGTYWYGVHAVDNAENRGWEPDPPGPIEVEVTQPDTIPPSASISIDSGATYTDSTSVTLSLTYSDGRSGVDKCRYKNSGGSWTGWQSCSSSKSWTLSSGDGTKTVYYEVKDNAGNIREVSDTIILDTTPPPTPSPDDDVTGWSTDNTPTFSWSAPSDTSGIAGYYYKIDSGSETWITTTSVTLSAQSDGTHTFHVKAKDNAGNTGGYGSHAFKIDDGNPPTPSPDDDVTGWSTDNTPTFSWSAPSDTSGIAGYYYKIDSGSETWITTTSVTLSAQSDGTHTFHVKAKDNAGNTGGYGSHAFKIDDGNPPTPSPDDDVTGWSTDNTPTFSWSAPSDTSGIAGYYYKIDSGSETWITTTSVTLSAQSDGTHTFHVKAKDNAGNTGGYGSHAFKIDDGNPPTPSPDDDVTGWSNDNTPTFTWSAPSDTSGIAGYYYKIDSGSETWITTTTVTLPAQSDGTHTFHVKAKDNAGNTGNFGSHEFKIDAENPPTPSPDDGVTGWSTDNTPTFSWSAPSDASGIAGYYWKVDSGTETWITTTSVTLSAQSDGTHTFHAKAKDNAGNTGSYGSHEFKIDTTEPEAPTLHTTPDPPSHDFGNLFEGQTRSWTFDVTNCGTGTLDWTTSDDQSWIGVTPAGGSTTTETDEVTVTIDTTGLSVGTYTGQVTIDAGAGGSKIGTITVTVDDDPDTTPPSAVTDLTATNPTTTTMTLGWTAPGDDGSTGTAASYDVRYRAGAAITDWNSANPCTGELTPGPTGSTETFVVTGLSPSTTYYFALKTADEVPNQSPISNSPQETTSGEVIGTIKGDLNGDGTLTPADAAIALEIAAGSRPFDDAADVSGDGMVTSLDALMIMQAAAGAISL